MFKIAQSIQTTKPLCQSLLNLNGIRCKKVEKASDNWKKGFINSFEWGIN